MNNSTDYLIRGLLKELNIRFMFAETTGTVNAGIKIHDTDPVAALVFGRALTVGALSAPLLETQEKYSFSWEYPGAISKVFVDVNAEADIRGMLSEPHVYGKISSEDELYGRDPGKISVIKFAEGKILNSGTGKATLGDVAADAAFFFSVSDQIETEISIAMQLRPDIEQPVSIACGFMIQAMPDCDLLRFDACRKLLASEKFRSVLAHEMPVEKKLWVLLGIMLDKEITGAVKEQEIIYTFAENPGFRCSCSKEKMKDAVKTLGKDDLEDFFSNADEIKIKCQFCHCEYAFRQNELSFD